MINKERKKEKEKIEIWIPLKIKTINAFQLLSILTYKRESKRLSLIEYTVSNRVAA